jgi:O-6-methylguanine DNA methyltransferase
MAAREPALEERLAALRVDAPSGFAEAVLARVGLVDEYASLAGPVGRWFVAFNRHGISFVAPGTDEAAFEQMFADRFHRPARRTAAARAASTADLAGMPFDLRGLSPFEEAVLAKTREIPGGQVRTYAWVAREIGRPRAVRAVGSALGRNPVPLMIPCHRVVRSDGHIGNYGFGPAMKRSLLIAEGVAVSGGDDALVASVGP